MAGHFGVTPEGSSDFVTVKLPGRDLGEFLSSMLGQKRTTTKEFNHIFTVDINWFLNFLMILQQRISSQNNSKLISSHIDLIYDNGKQVRLSNADQLRNYQDVSNDISYSINAHFTFLIVFPYNGSPERQDISISAKADTKNVRFRGDKNAILKSLAFPITTDKYHIIIDLEHTDLSWAEDIINLASNHIDASFKQRSALIEILRAYITLYAPVAGFFLGIFGAMYRDNTFRRAKGEFVTEHANLFDGIANSTAAIEEKINIIFRYFVLSESMVPKNILPFIYVFIIPIFVSILLVVVSRIDTPSYVVLNQASLNYKTETTKRRRLIRTIIWTTIVSGMAVNLMSSFLYDKIGSMLGM